MVKSKKASEKVIVIQDEPGGSGEALYPGWAKPL